MHLSPPRAISSPFCLSHSEAGAQRARQRRTCGCIMWRSGVIGEGVVYYRQGVVSYREACCANRTAPLFVSDATPRHECALLYLPRCAARCKVPPPPSQKGGHRASENSCLLPQQLVLFLTLKQDNGGNVLHGAGER